MKEKQYLFCPGPVMDSEKVRQALLHPDMCHRVPSFENVIQNVQNKLLEVYKANEDYAILLITGSGTAANETVISSCFTADDEVLLISNVEFGGHRAVKVPITLPKLFRCTLPLSVICCRYSDRHFIPYVSPQYIGVARQSFLGGAFQHDPGAVFCLFDYFGPINPLRLAYGRGRHGIRRPPRTLLLGSYLAYDLAVCAGSLSSEFYIGL